MGCKASAVREVWLSGRDGEVMCLLSLGTEGAIRASAESTQCPLGSLICTAATGGVLIKASDSLL